MTRRWVTVDTSNYRLPTLTLEASLPFSDAANDGAVGDGVTDDTAAIQAALTAVPNNRRLVFAGHFKLAGSVSLTGKTNVVLDFTAATVTQTTSASRTLILDGCTSVTVKGGRWFGVGTDYVNTSTVYLYNAVELRGNSTGVTVEGCHFENFAGAGVLIFCTVSTTLERTVIRNCKIIGPGAAEITPVTDNFSAGVVVGTQPGTITNWVVDGCEISAYAQGIVTSDTTECRIVNNYIRDITGQHGIYLAAISNAVIANNIIRDTALQGMKIQMAATTPEATDITIADNVIKSPGSHGILLTRTAGTGFLRRITVTGNVVSNTEAGDGIRCEAAVNGAVVSNNMITDCVTGSGIRVGTSSTKVTINGNRINGVDQAGIYLDGVTGAMVNNNVIDDPGRANDSANEFGIYLVNACTEITTRANIINDASGNMRYGFYFNPTSTATLVCTDNYVAGATDYGIRFQAAGTVREFARNDVSGTTGRVLNLPTSGLGARRREYFDSAAPTTGTHVVGDVTWNHTPAAAGFIGWVCTTAGTPGTWKTFGAISA